MRPKIVNMEFKPPERRCGFLVNVAEVVHCDAPATHHVFWVEREDCLLQDGDVAYSCEQHVTFCLAHDPWRVHVVGPDCGMPGSQFHPEENVCRCDDPEVWAASLEEEARELELVG